ncbi:MAG: EAL domain-containing protein [Hormoscilla sp. SP5CHS1]|nr:EAL domain-containing protein [Hormoscilla sp. SP12CHS1]MBC6454114.1 EAL domain-containing protein [Hormoscilla sp. SP5CHS1]
MEVIFDRVVNLFEQGFDPKYLDLELTESTVVQNLEVAIATLQELKTLGVQLALDDFGTGYSSLSYLQRFPFDILKIDRVFIHQSTVNEKNKALTTGIIKMAHQLHLKVIAEGVEREAERNLLCQQHCDEMQGYLFSRPLTAKGFQQLLFS